MNKIFIFRVRLGTFPGQTKLIFTQADIDLLQECIDGQKGFGTVFIKTSRRTGALYGELMPPDTRKQPQAEPAAKETTGADQEPGKQFEDEGPELPF